MQPAPSLAPHAHTLRLPNVGVVQIFVAGPANAPAILLVHGLQDEADTWRHVFLPLAQNHRVVAIDLPGYGRSAKGQLPYSVWFYVDVLLGVLRELRIDKVALVGNSMGAMICETLALLHPQRVAQLVLVAGTIRIVQRPPSTNARLNPIKLLLADYYDSKYFASLRQNPQAAFDTLLPFYANLPALPQADRDFLFQRVNERVWDEAQRRAALAVQRSFLWFFVWRAPKLIKLIPTSAVPTTVIWGGQDHVVPLRNGAERAQAQAGAQFINIAGAGHLPHQEKPEDFLQLRFGV
jgi:pimeloyl-ACP methyl ester carboxylesterase